MKLYVVAVVELPPKSLVVITPLEAKLQLAWLPPLPTKTLVVSVKVIALSDEPTTVNTVPEKLPAIVPSDPAAVVKLGAVEAVIILFVDLPARPSGFSILT